MNTMEDIYKEAFNDELEKISKLRVGDIEDNIGDYLSDDLEEKARALIKKETAERFGVRNPIRAGLMSFGLWPAISKGNAIDQVTKTLARKNPEVRDMISGTLARARKQSIENAQLQTDSDKANQIPNAVGASVLPILAAMSHRNN